jgi:hypothetical protein
MFGWLLSAAVVGVLAPAGAGAVTLGSLPASDPGACTLGSTSAFLLQTATASIPYAVPAGGGVITSWSTSFGPPGANVELVVSGPLNAGSFPVVGFDSETLPSPIPAGNVSTFMLSSPIAVQAGDLIGLFYSGSSGTRCIYPAGSSDQIQAGTTEPSAGGTLTPISGAANVLTNVSVNLATSVDVGVSGVANPHAITTGDFANLAFQLTADQPIPDFPVTAQLPSIDALTDGRTPLPAAEHQPDGTYLLSATGV